MFDPQVLSLVLLTAALVGRQYEPELVAAPAPEVVVAAAVRDPGQYL